MRVHEGGESRGRMRLAVAPTALHWGHGDGLVLRGLTELPVVLGPSSQT